MRGAFGVGSFGVGKSVAVVGVGAGGFVTSSDHCFCVIRSPPGTTIVFFGVFFAI